MDINVGLLDQVRRQAGFSSRTETITEALRLLQRKLALASLVDDIGKHPKGFRAGYDPEAGEA